MTGLELVLHTEANVFMTFPELSNNLTVHPSKVKMELMHCPLLCVLREQTVYSVNLLLGSEQFAALA